MDGNVSRYGEDLDEENVVEDASTVCSMLVLDIELELILYD